MSMLCTAVVDYIRSPVEGILKRRRSKCRVNDQLTANCMYLLEISVMNLGKRRVELTLSA